MPHVIPVRNVHEAYPEALNYLLTECVAQDSRNGRVYVSPMPVLTTYQRPTERVVFWEERDANPYLHFMEALGFLGGRSDVEFYARYAKQMRAYSDDGISLPASYGVRWRTYFGQDQLVWAVRRLRADPNDRRVVLTMWDGHSDPLAADRGSKDVPCNTNIFLNIFDGALNMMINCRSNDVFWGAYGANAVHMSFLHEYLARMIGVNIGWMTQNSFNWHAYENFYTKVMNERTASKQENSLRHNMTLPFSHRWNPYSAIATGGLQPFPLCRWVDQPGWDEQLAIFLDGAVTEADGLSDPFFLEVAVPVRDSYEQYRVRNYEGAERLIAGCRSGDWQRGCQEWLERRARGRATGAGSAD